MADYQPKNGSFSLFKNLKKEKDTHPDYKGDGISIDGTPVWVSAWIKDGKSGKFMSCNMQPKQERQERKEQKPAGGFNEFEDNIPF